MEDQSQSSPLFGLSFDDNSGTLRSAAGWAKVLGVLGVVFGAFFFVIAFIVQNSVEKYGYYGSSQGREATSLVATGAMIVYVLIGVLTIIGSIFPITFANKILAALRTNDPSALRSGFSGLRNYFAYWSILMIIGLLFMLLAIASGAMKGI